MAVNTFDPTTGRPIFLDGDAPDTAVNPTAVGQYAADVGNRIVRANLAALDAYEYKRDGLMGYAADTKTDYFHDGTGWKVRIQDTGWLSLGPFSSGWSAQSPDAVGYRIQNGMLFLRGRINANNAAGTGTQPFVNALPPEARPSQDTAALVGLTGGSGTSVVAAVTAAGVIMVYKTASTALLNLPLNALGAVPIG